MNYIELINNFWKADLEYSFTGNETKLYMFLLHTSNSLGWKNPFRLSYRQIELGSGLSVNTVKAARNKLKQFGLIDFVEGKKGCAKDIANKAIYEIRLSKSDNQMDYHMSNHKGNQSCNQIRDQVEDINKLETVNQNLNLNRNIMVEKNIFEEFRSIYPGVKGQLETEFANFVKKHEDHECVIHFLMPALLNLIEWRNAASQAGQFVPQYANLSTWINQRRWEIELPKVEHNGNNQLSSHSSQRSGENRHNSGKNDADNKRAELASLKQLARAVLRGSVSKVGE